MRDGLSSLHIMALEIEVAAKVVLDWMNSELCNNLNHSPLIMDCRARINQVPQVRMMHCFREANKCEDALACKGPSLQQDFVVFESLPVDISMLLYYDQIGMYYERIRPQTVGFLG